MQLLQRTRTRSSRKVRALYPGSPTLPNAPESRPPFSLMRALLLFVAFALTTSCAQRSLEDTLPAYSRAFNAAFESLGRVDLSDAQTRITRLGNGGRAFQPDLDELRRAQGPPVFQFKSSRAAGDEDRFGRIAVLDTQRAVRAREELCLGASADDVVEQEEVTHAGGAGLGAGP